jgi:hypothetical protein
VIPRDLSDETLKGLPILGRTVGNRFDVLFGKIGYQTSEKYLGVFACFGAAKIFEIGFSELLEAAYCSCGGFWIYLCILFNFLLP